MQEFIIGAFLGGCLFGLIPLLIGKYYNYERLGGIGFLLCVAGSMILGMLLSVPIAVIFSIIIYLKRNRKKER